MSERVAVIAVHGVADQKLGDTSLALAEMLVARSPNGASYGPGVRSELVLQVPPLAPATRVERSANTIGKKLRQSAGSDFLKEGWSPKGAPRALDAGEPAWSRGAAYTDYLLVKAQQNGMGTDTCVAPCIGLRRNQAGQVREVDIFEMYWADLSRLSGSVPRILAEMFTLFFRLSSLGRDAVQTAAASFAASRPWQMLRWLQTSLDWLYSRVLALLFLQLAMVALILVPLALASGHVPAVHEFTSVAAGSMLALWLAYRTRRFLVAAAVGLAAGAVLLYAHPALTIGFLWLALLSFAYDWWMRICEERFRMTRIVGLSIWTAFCALICTVAIMNSGQGDVRMWIWATLTGMEWVLLAIVLWWAIAGILLMPAWLVAGFVVRRSSPAARASVATGRMGLVISLGFFLVLTMCGWAMVNKGVEAAVNGFDYTPLIFDETVTPCEPGACAPGFLEDRFIHSTETFSAVCVLLLLLVAYLLAVVTPSVLSERGYVSSEGGRLGRWLTLGYRYLDRLVAVIVAAGVLLAFVTALILLWFQLSDDPRISGDFDPLFDFVADASRQFLTPLVYAAGVGTVALTAAGHLLSRYVPWLRVPLDAGIDVDNHLREFPRKAIPRARIFSRYVALLEYITGSEQRYDRIVVVSHSQGTVISAELLRYLKERVATRGDADAMHALWGRLEGRIRLLTAGCPLRQLYAARFPVMYDWILATGRAAMGPAAADVGVTQWLNLYTTGDYVGRWLWSRQAADGDVSAPLVDEPVPPGADLYLPNGTANGDLTALMGGRTEKDICLGAGAHTRYFDNDQERSAPIVACAIDAMINP